jgi:hypothetical protein
MQPVSAVLIDAINAQTTHRRWDVAGFIARSGVPKAGSGFNR